MLRGMRMNKLTALSGMLALLCVQAAHADHTARFPEELRFTGINEGYAVVGWTVAPDGRIEDTIVLQASHPAFGKTALEALPKRLLWTQGAVLPRYDSAEFIFKQTGSIHSYSSTAEMIRQAKKEQRGTVPTATIAAA